ncbi:nrdI Flavodoxin like family protein [Yersinia pseudotuberculosis]|nr:nrdI Flavodoxin like family protein [Yersinia pseudotuberculosis]
MFDEVDDMNPLVYFSSSSENSHRFVEKLQLPAIRIPIAGAREKLRVEQPYILLVPSYGGGQPGWRGTYSGHSVPERCS